MKIENMTIGVANGLRLNYLSILNKTSQVPLSSVILCSVIEATERLNKSLESFDKTKDLLVKQYGKNNVIKKEEDPESYEKVKKELDELSKEPLDVDLNQMSLTYEELVHRLSQIDIPITQMEILSLKHLCKRTVK